MRCTLICRTSPHPPCYLKVETGKLTLSKEWGSGRAGNKGRELILGVMWVIRVIVGTPHLENQTTEKHSLN